jgi:Protein of unknown function (DUF3551)
MNKPRVAGLMTTPPRLRCSRQGDLPMANLYRSFRTRGTAMRFALAFAAIATFATFDAASPVSAQGAWCAQYSGSHGGATNCGFYTLEQCRAAVSGVGGECSPSPYAYYPGQPIPRKLRRLYQ